MGSLRNNRETLLSGVSKIVLQYLAITDMAWRHLAGAAARKHFSAASDVIMESHYEDEIDHSLERTVGSSGAARHVRRL
jgi:hypothetical protein